MKDRTLFADMHKIIESIRVEEAVESESSKPRYARPLLNNSVLRKNLKSSSRSGSAGFVKDKDSDRSRECSNEMPYGMLD